MGSGLSGSHGYMSCSTIAKSSTSELLRGSQYRLQRGHPGRRFAHHATRHGRPERHLVRPHLGQDLRIHLLEVEVPDALPVRLDELDAVAAAVRVVPGVQAQRRPATESVASRKRATFSSLSMCVSACGWTTMFSPYRSRTSWPSRSVCVVRSRHCVGGERVVLQDLAGLVVPPEGRDDDQMLGAHRLGERGDVRDVRPGGVPHVGAAVQPGEDRAGRDRAGRAARSRPRGRPGRSADSRTGPARSTRSRTRRPRRGSAARGPAGGRRGTRRPRSRGPSRCGCGTVRTEAMTAVTTTSWASASGRRGEVSRPRPNVRTKLTGLCGRR